MYFSTESRVRSHSYSKANEGSWEGQNITYTLPGTARGKTGQMPGDSVKRCKRVFFCILILTKGRASAGWLLSTGRLRPYFFFIVENATTAAPFR